jgi:hypothetical protein
MTLLVRVEGYAARHYSAFEITNDSRLKMAIGDGIRRNIASVDLSERAILRDAMVQLNQRRCDKSTPDMCRPIGRGVTSVRR